MKLAGWLLLGLLIEGMLAVPMIVFGSHFLERAGYDLAGVMISVAGWTGIGGLSLALATWAVMSGKMVHWRLVGVTAPFIFPICLSQIVNADGMLANYFLFLQTAAFFQGLSLLFLRGAGIRLEGTSGCPFAKVGVEMTGPEDVDDGIQRPRFQFTIATMLSLTAALAVLLSSLNTAEYVLGEGTLREVFTWQNLVYLGFDGLYALALLWTVFRTRSVWGRIGMLILSVFLLILPMVIAVGFFDLGMILPYGGGFLLGMVFHLIMFLPARLAGYRLVRHRRVAGA
jgi:hypothetical protein